LKSCAFFVSSVFSRHQAKRPSHVGQRNDDLRRVQGDGLTGHPEHGRTGFVLRETVNESSATNTRIAAIA